VAPVVVHDKRELSPDSILVGFLVNVLMTGFDIVTVTDDVTLPLTLVAVNVYVVVETGETTLLPSTATLPTP
jgi:hypothetical protein